MNNYYSQWSFQEWADMMDFPENEDDYSIEDIRSNSEQDDDEDHDEECFIDEYDQHGVSRADFY